MPLSIKTAEEKLGVRRSVAIPAESVALLIGVDRILDMSRTAINVADDVVASKTMDQWSDGETKK